MLPGTNAQARFEFDGRARTPFAHRIARVKIKQQSRELCIALVNDEGVRSTLAIHGSRSVSFMSSCSDIQ
jgi:hypothetical protein